MLQRIQTIYLLIVVALNVALFFLPLANMQSATELFSFDLFGVSAGIEAGARMVYPTWALVALASVSGLLALLSIGMFKKRMFQIRLSIFNAILNVCFYALFSFFAWVTYGKVGASHFGVEMGLALPFINAVLLYLAIRNIGADEALVRSLDRLR